LLIESCKMSDVDPIDYIPETLRVILDGHPMNAIQDRTP